MHDLFQAGALGLALAVKLFDPSKGAKFGTYAATAIWSQAMRHLERSGLILVSRHYRERAALDAAAAAKLTVVDRVKSLERDFHMGSSEARSDDENARYDPEDYRVPVPPEPDDWPEAEAALAKLPKRLRQVVRLNFWEGKTLRESAEILGVSAETVRTLRRVAMERLRRRMGVEVSA